MVSIRRSKIQQCLLTLEDYLIAIGIVVPRYATFTSGQNTQAITDPVQKYLFFSSDLKIEITIYIIFFTVIINAAAIFVLMSTTSDRPFVHQLAFVWHYTGGYLFNIYIKSSYDAKLYCWETLLISLLKIDALWLQRLQNQHVRR